MFRICTVICTLLLVVPISVGAASNSFRAGQQIGDDTTPPTVPANVLATPIATSQIDVTWDASYDLIGLAGYELWRDGFSFATISAPTTEYNDTGLTASTTYSYVVRAYDAAGNYSAFSATTSTTTFAIPAPTPTPSATTTRPIEGTWIGQPLSIQLSVQTFSDKALIELAGNVPFIASIRFGTTFDALDGSLSIETYRKSHTTAIEDLRPGTSYTVVVVATDARGNKVVRSVTFKTPLGVDTEPPPNVRDLKAHALRESIDLSWKNPLNPDFIGVRIMRVTGTIPVDPYDGELVYEGKSERFTDLTVTPGKHYGYAVFSRDVAGNYSSGAIVFVRAYDPSQIGEAGISIPDTNSSTKSGLLETIEITQEDAAIPQENGQFEIKNNQPFTISLPAHTLPKVLKTIVVTLEHPDGKGAFSFLLRTDDRHEYYTATIAGLIDAGTYRAVVSVLNLESETIVTEEFTISVAPGNSFDGEFGKVSERVVVMVFLLVLLFMFIILAIRLWKRGRSDRTK